MMNLRQSDESRARRRMSIRRSIVFILVAVLFVSVCFTTAPNAAPPEGEEIGKIGQIQTANGASLRSQPTRRSSRLSLLRICFPVEILAKVVGQEVDGVNTWYYVKAGTLEGYVHSTLVMLPMVPPPKVDPDFEAYMTDQGFPESYKPNLRSLHYKYPNWVFKAQHIKDVDSPKSNRKPLIFQKALDAESKPGINMVFRSSLLSHRSYESSDYYYWNDYKGSEMNAWKIYDAGGWMGASREIIAYSLDPRNFLNEQQIFQFELLSYNKEVHTVEPVQMAIAGTFMDKEIDEETGEETGEVKRVTFIDHRDDTTRTLTYPEIFIEAAEITNVNPFFLVQRCLMEVSRDGSNSVFGKVEGYENYYNFYNIGATAGGSPITNGLKYARYGRTGSGPTADEQERYWLPWNNQWRAIIGGAFWIGSGYINKGQDTQYSQKFNIDGDSLTTTYGHQYMGNVYAPCYEAARVYGMYEKEGLLNMPFVFKIPVLAELPEAPSPYPTSNESLSNWLKSVSISAGTLTPAFNPENYSYSVTVDATVNEITISGEPFHEKCTVNNTGIHPLSEGENTIVLEAVSERGTKRQYTIVVNKTDQIPTVINPTVNDSYVTREGLLLNACPEAGRNQAGKIRAALDIPERMTVTIKDAMGNVATDETLLGTGATIEWFEGSASSPSATLTLVIYGDTSGDGFINSDDLTEILEQMYKGVDFPSAVLKAMDTTRDGFINSDDLTDVLVHMYKGQPIDQQ